MGEEEDALYYIYDTSSGDDRGGGQITEVSLSLARSSNNEGKTYM